MKKVTLVLGCIAALCTISCSNASESITDDQASPDNEAADTQQNNEGEQQDNPPSDNDAADQTEQESEAVEQEQQDNTPDTDTNPAAKIIGIYAEDVMVTTLDKMPVLGDVETTSHYYGINHIEMKDGKLISRSFSCRSVTKSSAPIETILPDSLTQCIPELVGALEVVEENGTISMNRETVYMPVGVKLDDPVNDALPTDEKDPRIWDQDGDGKPGLTIEVKSQGMTGKIYAIRKEVGKWDGVLQQDGTIKGYFYDSSLQKVIGSSNPIFKMDIESKPHPDKAKSTVTLKPLTEEYDCKKLLDNFETIFGS